MILPTALAIALAAGSQTSPELCVGFDNRIASDMRIHESDLTRSAAVEALDRLKGMIERGSLGGEFKLGALNQSKIIHGHILLRQAQADRMEFGAESAESRDSVQALCTWLSSEGFWYD